MKTDALLWHNLWKRPLPQAVQEAAARHLARLGSQPTHVILPLGEYPAEVAGMKVETDRRLTGLYLQVYADPKGGLAGPCEQ